MKNRKSETLEVKPAPHANEKGQQQKPLAPSICGKEESAPDGRPTQAPTPIGEVCAFPAKPAAEATALQAFMQRRKEETEQAVLEASTAGFIPLSLCVMLLADIELHACCPLHLVQTCQRAQLVIDRWQQFPAWPTVAVKGGAA